MKLKHFIMVSLILAILTIGAVSAADDADSLAAEETGGVDDVAQSPLENEETIGEDSSEDVLPDLSEKDFETEINKNVTLSTNDNVVSVDISSDEVPEGKISVSVNDRPETYDKEVSPDEYYYSFKLSDLDITEANTYLIGVKFISESQTIDLGQKTITVNELTKDYFEAVISEIAILSDDDSSAVSVHIDGEIDGSIIVTVDGTDLDSVSVDWASFSLSDLGIAEIGTYEIKVRYVSDDETTVIELGEGILNVKEYDFDVYIENETIAITDDDTSAVSIGWKGVVSGKLTVIVDGQTAKEYEIPTGEDEDTNVYFTLSDLSITSAGTYEIEVKHNEELLEKGNLTVSGFDVKVLDPRSMKLGNVILTLL